ncbi:MAG: carbonic anhydrase [Anaerolineae bacterium]|nr:carbonic anhydrase [Anaerolineae bacterium]
MQREHTVPNSSAIDNAQNPVTRRRFLNLLAGTSAALLAGTSVNVIHAESLVDVPTTRSAEPVTPDEALKRLLDGNARFVSGKATHDHQNAARQAEVATGQAPFAVIVSCADSRVPPEIVFDQGLGDLFVVRTAGNIVDDVVLGSIEYAVANLGATLIMVLGHERCGAVHAAVEAEEGTAFPGHIAALAEAIKPAVESVKEHEGHDVEEAAFLDLCVRENIQRTTASLAAAEPIVAQYVRDGKVKVVGARYDLDEVKVELL